jgi:uncharacterized repeat protein (TIGR01451 family)
MRAVTCWILFAATCGLVATAVHGQVYQSGSNNSPLLLADGSSSFGGSRKMLGPTVYTASAPSGDNSKSDSVAPPFTGSPAADATSSQTAGPDGAPPASVMKPTSDRDGGVQSVYPSATAKSGSTNSSSAKSRATSSDSNDSASGGALKSLQQRLTSVRKSPPAGAPTSDVRPPVVEGPPLNSARLPTPAMSPTVAAPIVSTASPVATRSAMVGSNDGPAPPGMPDIRSAQLPKPATAPLVDMSNDTSVLALKAGETSEMSAPSSVSSGPIVGGPLNSSRRGPTVLAPVGPSIGTSVDLGSSRGAAIVNPSAITADNLSLSRQSPLIGVETTGPRSITIGKEAAYTITVANAGEAAAQDVSVSIKIPGWTEVVGTKVSSGTANPVLEQRNEPLVWRLPRIEARSKEQLSVRLVPHESKPFELAVQWSCSPVASQAMVEVKEPKLAMTLDGPSEVVYGQSKVYRLTMTNPGTGDAENVVLFLAPVDGSNAPPTRHEVGIIRAGQNKPVEVELAARQAGTLSVKAVAVADGQLRAEVAEDILVRRAGLKAVVTGPELKFAGTPSSYTIVVTNPGNAPAENVLLAAILPAGAKFVSSANGQFVERENKVVWNLPTLRPGVEQEVEFRCTLNAPGANRVQVLATAPSDLSDSMAAITNVEALADLKLEVIDPPGPLAVGEEMLYEVHIRNRGTKAAENVEVAGFFSDGVEPVSAQGGQHEVAPGQVTFRPITAIAAGSEVVLKIKARADLPGTHVFRAEVNCQSMGAKLASEETTMFYGDGRSPARVAARPASTPSGLQTAPSDSSGTSAPAVLR